MSEKNLFSDFETTSQQQWKEKIISDLKGKDYDSTLIWTDEDGIEHQPFYHQENIANNDLVTAIQAAQKANKTWFFTHPDNLISDYTFSYTENLKDNKTNNLGGLSKTLLEAKKGQKKVLLDGNFFRQAGSTIVQELAYVLQATVDYFDAGTEQGMAGQEVASLLEFKLGFGNSYCSEIAKARAFRYLIQQVYKSYGVQHEPIVFGEACNYYHSHKDPHTNLLRLSTQAMSIILGNCDSVLLPNYDDIDEASTLGKRMSENIPRILKEESFFEEVQDVAQGSYYIEHLSTQLVQKSWELFLNIEAHGGLIPYTDSGTLKKALKDSHTKRLTAYQNKERVLLGVNTYINENATDLKIEATANKGIATYILSNEISQ